MTVDTQSVLLASIDARLSRIEEQLNISDTSVREEAMRLDDKLLGYPFNITRFADDRTTSKPSGLIFNVIRDIGTQEASPEQLETMQSLL